MHCRSLSRCKERAESRWPSSFRRLRLRAKQRGECSVDRTFARSVRGFIFTKLRMAVFQRAMLRRTVIWLPYCPKWKMPPLYERVDRSRYYYDLTQEEVQSIWNLLALFALFVPID